LQRDIFEHNVEFKATYKTIEDLCNTYETIKNVKILKKRMDVYTDLEHIDQL